MVHVHGVIEGVSGKRHMLQLLRNKELKFGIFSTFKLQYNCLSFENYNCKSYET